MLHTCDFFSIWYISLFPETPNKPVKKFYFYYGYWLTLFSFTKITLLNGCLGYILKRQVVLYRKKSHDLKYYSRNLFFYFAVLTKLEFRTLTKKSASWKNLGQSLKVSETPHFAYFLKVSKTPYFAYFIYFSLQVNTK